MGSEMKSQDESWFFKELKEIEIFNKERKSRVEFCVCYMNMMIRVSVTLLVVVVIAIGEVYNEKEENENINDDEL